MVVNTRARKSRRRRFHLRIPVSVTIISMTSKNNRRRPRPGVNFINILHTAFTVVDPARRPQKRKKIQLSHQCLFTLLGSTGIKAVCRTWMKFTPGVNFINILLTYFYKSEFCNFPLITVWVCDCLAKGYRQKSFLRAAFARADSYSVMGSCGRKSCV